MTEPQYTVGTDEQGRFTIVDQSNDPHVYRMPAHRYTDREEAQERADRYNAIKAGKL
jgi:hypothetical protein